MRRREFITMIAGSVAAILGTRGIGTARPRSGDLATMTQLSPPIEQAPTLLSAPIELAGDWGHMLPRAADQVVERMRHACLDGVRLLSDRQPTRLRVDEHTSGSPAVWLHPDGSTMAWVIVDIGERDWSKLAYQFGHASATSWPIAGSRTPNRSRRVSGSRKPWWRHSRFAASAAWRKAGSGIHPSPAIMRSVTPSPTIARTLPAVMPCSLTSRD